MKKLLILPILMSLILGNQIVRGVYNSTTAVTLPTITTTLPPCVPINPTRTPWATSTATPTIDPQASPTPPLLPSPTRCIPTQTPWATLPSGTTATPWATVTPWATATPDHATPDCSTSDVAAISKDRCVSIVPDLTPTAGFPFSATAVITPSQTIVNIGDPLTLLVDVKVSPGCQFPVFDITLTQQGNDTPIFAPDKVVVGPGSLSLPETITVTAVTTGTITFNVQLFGERYCGDFWNFTYVNGRSIPITALELNNRAYLPAALKD
ncbi:MAG: hypothetical protein GY796_12470 [Chloroflexi bacterium]|nr:hypothetical protein [Chloroflexota bacterium]